MARRKARKKEEEKGRRGNNGMIILQYKSATYRTRVPAPYRPPLPRAPLSRRGRSARRLIKFSGNQICHSAVRF